MVWGIHKENQKKDEVFTEGTGHVAETKSQLLWKESTNPGCGKENTLDTSSPVWERGNTHLSHLIRDQLAKIIQTTAITFNLTSDH